MNPKNREKYGCQKILKTKQNRYKTKRYINSFFEIPFKKSTQKLIQKGKDSLFYMTHNFIIKMNKEYENQSDAINQHSILRDPLESCQTIYKENTYKQRDQSKNIIFSGDIFNRQRRIIQCQNKIDLQLKEIRKLEETSLGH